MKNVYVKIKLIQMMATNTIDKLSYMNVCIN